MDNSYILFEDFVIRSPLFAFDKFLKLLSKISESENAFKILFQDKIIKNAIYLASPDLYNEVQKYLNNDLSDQKEINRLKYTLTKYFCRMSTRCTPFGLFAGCSTGSFNNQTNLVLTQMQNYLRTTRLDMNYVCSLVQDIANHPEIKYRIKYFSNRNTYMVGNKLRFAEYYYKDTKRVYKISAVDHSEYIDILFQKSFNGSYYEDLIKVLVNDEINREEAADFIDELIASQLLVSELEPFVTGPDYLTYLISILKSINEDTNFSNVILNITNKLEHIQSLIYQIDSKSIGTAIEIYNQIMIEIRELGIKFDKKYLFQTDMIKPMKASSLNGEIKNDILDAIKFLNRITFPLTQTPLTAFRDNFYERYEDSEMPLLNVLDNETGIGYYDKMITGDINTLIDDLNFPTKNTEPRNDWDTLQKVLLKKYTDAVSKNKDIIELEDSDFDNLKPRWDDLPHTFSAMCQIIQYNENAKEIYLNAAGNSSAANLLSRFCHADSQIREKVEDIIRKEEEIDKDCIYAEIVHLPESRIGNILLRPILRKYEIPYLTRSVVDKDFVINLSDLMVSIRQGRIVLRSKQLNKEIIPRLANAHNYSYNSLPVYHFLCDMQLQNKRGTIIFHWGFIGQEIRWLPRVKYKNVILSPARWKIEKEEIKGFTNINNDKDLISQITNWRQSIKMPSHVLLEENDNALFVDLENTLSIKTLFSIIKNRPYFELHEFIFDIDNAVLRSDEGKFTNEFIFSFYKGNNT